MNALDGTTRTAEAFIGHTSSLAAARRLVTDFLDEHRLGTEIRRWGEVVTSELATNAVQSSPMTPYVVEAAVTRDRSHVSVSVRSAGKIADIPTEFQLPVPADSAHLGTSGRGLVIVDRLSDDLHVLEHPDGTISVTAVVQTRSGG